MRWTQLVVEKRVRKILDRAEPRHRCVLLEFEHWLREEKCFTPATIAVRLACACEFLPVVAKRGDVKNALDRLKAGDIESFFIGYAENHAVNSRRCMASALRCLLRFTALRGWSDTELVASVPSVFSYQLASVPVGISDTSIDRVLAALKPDSPTQSRDRAILLLLATYGLRNGQVCDLRLGDLGWRDKQITFCSQKRSRAVRHVLTPAVAEALALYIRGHRPHADNDNVFLRHRRPSSPLTPEAVYGIVAHRIRQAGISSGPVSPRAFRYALATRLLNARQPYKLIADTFGHQSLRATAVYAKINRPFLEEAAAEWQALR